MQNKTAIALGTFDGVHMGHRAVLDLSCGYNNRVAVTFEFPPKAVKNVNNRLITTVSDKCRILKNLGFNEILLLEFEQVKDMSDREFLEFLQKKYNPQLITCGFNYRFGKNALGNTETLKEFCTKNRIDCKIAEGISQNGEIISSTVIRNLLEEGKIKKANSILTEEFSFCSRVISGDQRGRTIGFPTVNQKYPEELVQLKFGVYKTKVAFNGKEYKGITNIGIRPTYKSDFVISETHIIGFSGDLYGKNLKIIPQEFLREEKSFSSIDELKAQINIDLKNIKEK